MMGRSSMIVGASLSVLGAVQGAARAAEVPEELQGRWGKPTECKVKSDGLVLEPHRMSFAGAGGQQVVLTVEAIDVHRDKARLIVRRVIAPTNEQGGPRVGDSVLLERTGRHLQPMEKVSQGKVTNISTQTPMELCRS